jgi:DNA-binding NtrC family response regulator
VLLTGETGSGKEVAARFLHGASPGRERPFVAVNCAAIPPELMDSQVFGHERGAFTGAVDRHLGFAERAGDGLLFLDEIAELPMAVQAKLLRLLQERRFTRVGGTAELPFRARLACATNVDLAAAVARGAFRQDLYYRINVIEVRIPPLRDRPDEILPLARRFAAEVAARFGAGPTDLDPAAERALRDHPWPGNLRELRNRVERAVALCERERIGAADLFPERALLSGAGEEAAGALPTLAAVRDEAERRHIQAALRETEGRVQRAAELLGISRTTLWEKMRRLGVEGAVEEG